MPPLDGSSTISIALMLIILGFVWRLATTLAKIENALAKLKSVPARLRHIENHQMMFEEDVNNLFAAVRAGDKAPQLDLTRRTRFLPYEEDE